MNQEHRAEGIKSTTTEPCCIVVVPYRTLNWKFTYDKEHTICTVTATNDPSFETVCAWNFFISKYSILLWKSPKQIWMQNFYQIRQKPKIAVFCYVTSHNPFATTDLRLCFRQIPGSFPAFFRHFSGQYLSQTLVHDGILQNR